MNTKRRIGGYLRKQFSCDTLPFESIAALFLPLLAEKAVTIGFSTVNTAMVSSAGMASFSAVNLVNSYTSTLSQIFIGLAVGGSIYVAQCRGARQESQVRKAGLGAVGIATAAAILLTLLSIVFQPDILYGLFGSAEQEILDIAGYYMFYSCLSLPLFAFYTAELGVLRGIGEGKTALAITFIHASTLLVLNALLIPVLDLGITGLLLSTALSRLIAAVSCFWLKKRNASAFVYRLRELLHWDRPVFQKIMVLGTPVFMETLLLESGNLIIQTTLVTLGTQAVAAYGIIFSILVFSQIPNAALATMMYTVSGMCRGAMREDDCRHMTMRVHRLNTALYIAVGVLTVALHRPLFAAFHAEPDMYGPMFCSVALGMIAQTLFHTSAFTTANVLRAAGDGIFPTVVATAVVWCVRVLGGYLLAVRCGLGVLGVFLAMYADWMIRGILFSLRFRGSRWWHR